MKKLLLLLLCVPLIFSCNTEKDNYDKLIGYTYSGSELNEKLKEWEDGGGHMVGPEMTRSISFMQKIINV